MIARTILITDAVYEPVTDQQACDHVLEDLSMITKVKMYLTAARQSVEAELISVKLTQAVYELQMDDWYSDDLGSPVRLTAAPSNAGYITFPACPVINIVSVKYDDVNGAEQTLSPSYYLLDSASMPGRMRFTGNAAFPGVADKPNAVRIRFNVGYGTVGASDGGQSVVPAPLKAAVLLRLGQLYQQRTEENFGMISQTNIGVERLIAPYRIPV